MSDILDQICEECGELGDDCHCDDAPEIIEAGETVGEPVCVMDWNRCTERNCGSITSDCIHTTDPQHTHHPDDAGNTITDAERAVDSDDDQPKTARERKHEETEREMDRCMYSDPLKWNRLLDSLDS